MSNTIISRDVALKHIETIVLRNQGHLVPYMKETQYLDPIMRNASISHAAWETTADGQHAFIHVLLKRTDAELLMTELNLSYDELYELLKELGFQLSQTHLFWLNPNEMQLIHSRQRSYSSREDFGICVGDHTDIDVYGIPV